MMGTDTPSRKPVAAAAVAVLVMAAACGGGAEDPGDEGTADEEVAPETRHGDFEVLDGWSGVLPDAAGTVEITVDEVTTIELAVEGMQPDTEYPAHLHAGTCDDDPPGGEHWSSNPDIGPETPTHIHTYVITGDDGRGAMTDTSDLLMDDRALSVVVHATGANPDLQEAGTDRILCGELEPQ